MSFCFCLFELYLILSVLLMRVCESTCLPVRTDDVEGAVSRHDGLQAEVLFLGVVRIGVRYGLKREIRHGA